MRKKIERLLSREPKLKARDIANKLGTTRKDVNSVLYAHADRYEKDSDHKWSLIKGRELELVLPGGWVTGDGLERVLRRVGPVLNGLEDNVRIVFSPRCKTMIDCIARLLALTNQLNERGKHVALDFCEAEDTRTYLDRAGFFDQLDAQVTVLPERPVTSAARIHHGRSDTLVEFGFVDPESENKGLIEQLTKTFVRQASDEYEVAAFTVFSELIENVSNHSESSLNGFAGLQKYKGRREHIQTVISDSGVGIANTLRPALKAHYPPLYERFGTRSVENDIGLVTAAMSEMRVSRFGGARGLGFESSRKQAIRFDAQFSVRQEQFCLKFIYNNGVLEEVKKQRMLRSLLGTHICFDFYLD